MLDFLSNWSGIVSALVAQGRAAQTSDAQKNYLARVIALFRKDIRNGMKPAGGASAIEAETWEASIVIELANLIEHLPADMIADFAKNHSQIIGQLAKACHWKLRFRKQKVGELAEEGGVWQAGILMQMAAPPKQKKDAAPSRLNRQLGYIGETERPAVAYRTLRAVIAYARASSGILLFQYRNRQLVLAPLLVMQYLPEQVSLYVYLFKNREDAAFIDESLLKVAQWCSRQIAVFGPNIADSDQVVNDIRSEIAVAFVGKYDSQRATPTAFFLDAALTTHLIGYAKNNKTLGQIIKQEYAQTDVESVDWPDDEGFTEANVDSKSASNNSPLLPDIGGFTDQHYQILTYCKNNLKPACRELIKKRYNNHYANLPALETLAHELKEEAGALSDRLRRCLDNLKGLVKSECTRRNIFFVSIPR